MITTRRIAGRISYRTDRGRETGRERFELIDHPNGHILRAACEMDDAPLHRDVTLAMDVAWHPLDGYCRIIKPAGIVAAVHYARTDAGFRFDGMVDGQVRTGTLPLEAPLPYLGLHPLQGDALIVNARGTDRPGVFVPVPSATNAHSPDGDEDVGLHALAIDVAYVGEERITVAAGGFAARRYALRWDPAWPQADLWVRREDCVFLAMSWSHVGARYELTSLEETAD